MLTSGELFLTASLILVCIAVGALPGRWPDILISAITAAVATYAAIRGDNSIAAISGVAFLVSLPMAFRSR